MRILAELALVIAFSSVRISITAAQGPPEYTDSEKTYYSKWIGVKAPPIGPRATVGLDRIPVVIEKYHGKRLLLYSFDSGNFVVGGPSPEIVGAGLRAVNEALKRAGPDSLAAVGFTAGVAFWLPEQSLPEECVKLQRLPNFHIAIVSNRKFEEPYGLLVRPSGIVIDQNGVIQSVFTHEMSIKDIEKATQGPDWSGPLRSPPMPEDPSIVSPVIECAELKKGVVAAFQSPEGWPNEIPLIGVGGKLIWTYRAPQYAGIDSAAWVDLDGDGYTEFIIGCNGEAGLFVASCEGMPVWSSLDVRNVWQVAGFSAGNGRPGLVLCTTAEGSIRVYDSVGQFSRSLPNEGHRITRFAAAEITSKGDRQILSIWTANAGSSDFVAASDLDGKLLWKYPIKLRGSAPEAGLIRPARILGDHETQWIVRSAPGEFVILDRTGQLIAQLELRGGLPTCWTVISRTGTTGLLIVNDSTDLVAYSLAAL